jgi:hypothetical protein
VTEVTAELLPKHPIMMLRAVETDNDLGIMEGEVLSFRCVECDASATDCFEILHENGCQLAGQTAPTTDADRPAWFGAHVSCPSPDLAAVGGRTVK